MKNFKFQTIIVFCIKIFSILLGFVLNVFLARKLGPDGLGEFIYSVSVLRLLIIVGNLGFAKLLVREIAALFSKKNWEELFFIKQWSVRRVFPFSIFLAILIGIISSTLNSFGLLETTLYFNICLVLFSLPICTITSLINAILKGYSKVFEAFFPEFIFGPILIIIFSIFSYSHSILFNSTGLVFFYVVSNFFVLLMAACFLKKTVTSISLAEGSKRNTIEYSKTYKILENRMNAWKKATIPMLIVNASQIIFVRSDIILIGVLLGAKEAGIYSVVMYGTQVASFVRTSASAVLEPLISASYVTDGERNILQRNITKITRKIFIFSLLLSFFIYILSPLWFDLFGSEFSQGSNALLVLIVGELIAASASASWKILVASGNEKLMAFSVSISAISNVLFNILLIPVLGITGAAVATSLSILMNTMISSYFSNRCGLKATIFGL